MVFLSSISTPSLKSEFISDTLSDNQEFVALKLTKPLIEEVVAISNNLRFRSDEISSAISLGDFLNILDNE